MDNNIKHIIYTNDLNLNKIYPDFKGEKVVSLDPRSAVYIATGIAAQNKETVLVFVNAGNSSRSAFSGMTEAYYRHLPIILTTVGHGLDYKIELNDVVNSHIVIKSLNDLPVLNDSMFPIHVELITDFKYHTEDITEFVELLKKTVNMNDYVYASKNLNFNFADFPCKVVIGGMEGCGEGSLSNVLGASLAKLRRRYIGLVSEGEFLHDLNTIGNINVNDSLVYIVFVKDNKTLISSYTLSLGFNVYSFSHAQYNIEKVRNILDSKVKTIILIEKD